METRIHPATLTAAAAVLGQAMPEFGDPQRLLAALRLATQAKEQPQTGAGPRLLTLRQAGERLGVCPRTIGHWVAEGKLPARKTNRKFVRVLESDLLVFVDNLPARAVTAADKGNSTKRLPMPMKKLVSVTSCQPHGKPAVSSALTMPTPPATYRVTLTRGKAPPTNAIHATPV